MSNLARVKDNFEVSALLCRSECALSSSFDFTAIVDNAFDQIAKRNSKRAEYYFLISNYIKNHQCSRLSSIIERIPTFIDGASQDDTESHSLIALIQEILAHGSSEVIALVSKTLSKIISTANKVAIKNSTSTLGLSVLEVFGKSKLRSLLVPTSKSVCQTCLQLIDRPDTNQTLLASVYTLFVSVESVESWAQHWLTVTEECGRVLALLGMRSNSKKATPTATTSTLPLLAALESKKHRGAHKTLYMLRVFQGLCGILAQMLVHGCATGPVPMNLTAFVPVSTLLLNANADLSTEDPVVSLALH